jgi:glycosyltransferase involved in cell wall biosynthesis
VSARPQLAAGLELRALKAADSIEPTGSSKDPHEPVSFPSDGLLNLTARFAGRLPRITSWDPLSTLIWGFLAMQISVVVTAYNYAEGLPTTLAPLVRDPATAEVVVVVDGSRDGSFEMLQRMAAGEPRLRPFFIENRGRTGALQFGVEQARCDVVLTLDQDVVAHEGLVSGHAALHAEVPGRVVLGYMPTTKPPRRPGSFVVERYADEYERVCALWERDPRDVLRRLWGGNLSIARRDLGAAGGCDAGVGLQYCHDRELGLRLLGVGLEAMFDRGLRAEHRFERSIPGFLKAGREQGRDLAIIGRLHPAANADLPKWRRTNIGGKLRRLALRARAYKAMLALGVPLLRGVGRLHLWRAEVRIGEFLERLEMQRGMQDGLRETSSWPTPPRRQVRVRPPSERRQAIAPVGR